MTDQSRVEAVARAIDQSGCWDTYDELMQAGGYFASDSLIERLERSKERAQAAIAANDAWLKADRRAKDKAVLKAEYPTTPRRPDK